MKSKGKTILIIILILIALGCAGYLGWYYYSAGKVEDSYDQAKQIAKGSVENVPEEVETKEIPIDFAALQETNPDVYAWITIEGTKVDYPVLQRNDNDSYYLDHSWDGAQASQGAIFTEAVNTKTFADFNTVIYGHQMGEGNDSMFHTLDYYLEDGFMEEHPKIVIYTPDRILTYEVFAAVIYDDRHLMHYYNYVMNSDRQAFIDSIFNSRDMRNRFRSDVSVTPEDKILSLSTCISAEPEHRLLVEAVLTDEK